MNDEIKEISKVDKQILDKIERILASELSKKEYDEFYSYFNEIKKPNIIIDIKDDANIKDYITNLQQENEKLKELCDKYEEHNTAFKLWKMKMEEIPIYEEKEDYKSRIDKAIEYIEEKGRLKYNPDELINILRGDSDE